MFEFLSVWVFESELESELELELELESGVGDLRILRGTLLFVSRKVR